MKFSVMKFLGAAIFLSVACGQTAPVRSYKIVAVYPHDRKAFTEGLEFHDGYLYESTGLNGQSSIRKVDLVTGAVIKQLPLSTVYFGEGVTFFGGRLFQLTYQSQIGFVYDATSWQPLGNFRYSGEGWALTHDAKHLIMSDGTSAIRYLDPATQRETGRIVVRDGTKPVANVNELEYIEGEIWANVWQTDWIARIDPRTGQVNSWVDLTGLLKPSERTPDTDVLNGIAYDARRKRIFVTGKKWPKLFEIRVVEK
jgi:glutaminyl-peptide cyclotransferase